ncbi:putative ABC transporter ATP-binding protein [Nocardia brasiliensis NBRC 14402]|uniref:ABC transporter ATP-binding protein n=1 Tax=Nocardia brasiliensis TaxID=37326 RepID=UPI0002F015A2|nr:ABC transporter ATP-binding protein [Nocardia brasiliensis]ASF08038.1 ABC transporter ATP-binding protein [Nocardia brasiliensis]GAJ80897.1 putative ABC transporter ATP-binding protein [Nocardia brasiliensis NBRC 14402]SUB54328.1 Daunorubicin/doxorubicin resistance ATP-binding protein DrrA [Nocardia brasiliensis]
MLEICDLNKSYGKKQVLTGVDLLVRPGEIVGLLGPNGAGKTTTASIVAGLTPADSGTVRIDDIDLATEPRQARRKLGFAPQELGVYPTLTARENLTFFGRLMGVGRRELPARIDEVASRLGITPFLTTRAHQLSGGQQRRLHTAMALLHEPDVLWLDEPTVGADVSARQDLLDEVRNLADRGAAVVYATHYLPELEVLGARVVVLHQGRILAQGSAADLIERHAQAAVSLEFATEIPASLGGFLAAPGATVVEGRRLDIPTNAPGQLLAQLFTTLDTDTEQLLAAEIQHPNLENAYLAIMRAAATGADQPVEGIRDAVA